MYVLEQVEELELWLKVTRVSDGGDKEADGEADTASGQEDGIYDGLLGCTRKLIYKNVGVLTWHDNYHLC